MRRIFCCWLTVLAGMVFVFCVSAEPAVQTVRLKDGSVVTGRVLSLAKGLYTVETSSMGIISVKQEDVVAIVAGSGAVPSSLEEVWQSAPATAGISSEAMQGYQQKIMSNPQVMQDLQALVNDPEIVAIVSDPELQAAIMKKDLSALQKSDKFRKFATHPTILKMVGEVTQSETMQAPSQGKE